MPNIMSAPKSFLTAAPPPAAPVGPKEIVELQRRLVEEGNALAMVNAKSTEITGEIARLKGGAPPAPNFDNARESILADHALGKVDAAALKEFDQETADATKKYDATVRAIREKIAPLEATTAGLRRKAGMHSRTIESLRTEHRRLCLEYLLNAAEDAGKEYVDAITRAVKAMDLVITFASLHKRAGGENRIGEDIGTLDIPPLGTASTRGTLPAMDPTSRNAAYDAAEKSVLDLLKSEGIAVPFPNVDAAAPVKAHAPGLGFGLPIAIARPPEPLLTGTGEVAPTTAVSDFDPFTGQG